MSFNVDFHPELIDDSVFLAPDATVLGDVVIGPESSIWFGSVIRGDTESIRIGRQCNIQDHCVLHADPGFPCVIGDQVTVGHGAIVHGASVEDHVLIGMRAVVLNGARIGRGSLIAAGSVITESMVIPPDSVVAGLPAKIRSTTTPRHREMIEHAASHYVQAAQAYRDRLPRSSDQT